MSESADYLAEQCHKDKGTYSQVETRHVRAVLAENERLRQVFHFIAQDADFSMQGTGQGRASSENNTGGDQR